MHIGISAYFHDSSIALIDDRGNLVDFKKEEWLSRVKGDKSFPRMSLNDILDANQLDCSREAYSLQSLFNGQIFQT